MSIIGRLDEQVDAMLIAPIEKRRVLEKNPAPKAEEHIAMPAPHETEAAKDESARDESLPIWLL